MKIDVDQQALLDLLSITQRTVVLGRRMGMPFISCLPVRLCMCHIPTVSPCSAKMLRCCR